MSKYIFFLFCFLFVNTLFCQQSVIDSLQIELKKASNIEQAKILNELSYKSYRLSDLEKCFKYANEALKKAKEENQLNQQGEALKNIAIYYTFNTNIDVDKRSENVIESVDNAMSIFKETQNHDKIVDLYNILYIINLFKGDLLNQKEYLQKGIDYCEEHSLTCPKILSSLAGYHLKINMFQKSLFYSTKALEHAKLLNDKRFIAIQYTTIGNVYAQLEDYDKAIEYNEVANNMYIKLESHREIAHSYFVMSELYRLKEDYEKALVFAIKGIKYAKQYQLKDFELHSEEALSRIYLEKKEFNEALKYGLNALNLTKKNNPSYGPQINMILGEVYYYLNDYDNAYSQLTSSNLSLEENKWIASKNNYYYLSKIDSIRGNYKSAFMHHKKYKEANDSIFNQNKIAEITKMQTQFEVQKKDDEITLLNTNLDLEKSNKQRLFYIIGLIISFLSLGVLFLIYRIRAKRKLFEQKSKNLQIELNSKNRELVRFSVHVQQKNNALTDLKNKVETLIKTSSKEIQVELKQLKYNISSNINLDEDWEKIKQTFNEVYPSFFKNLLAEHNKLSQLELRYCAYLKMNISPKEIAQFLNIEHRSVYQSIYRIRKKLNVNSEEFMVKYINAV